MFKTPRVDGIKSFSASDKQDYYIVCGCLCGPRGRAVDPKSISDNIRAGHQSQIHPRICSAIGLGEIFGLIKSEIIVAQHRESGYSRYTTLLVYKIACTRKESLELGMGERMGRIVPVTQAMAVRKFATQVWSGALKVFRKVNDFGSLSKIRSKSIAPVAIDSPAKFNFDFDSESENEGEGLLSGPTGPNYDAVASQDSSYAVNHSKEYPDGVDPTDPDGVGKTGGCCCRRSAETAESTRLEI